MSYIQPLSVYFIWHHHDSKSIGSHIDYCYDMLKRNSKRPFSRSLNIPVFFRTSIGEELPSPIENTAQKSLFFIFMGKQIVACDKWNKYISELPIDDNHYIIPIAIDNLAFKFPGDIGKLNFIRAYDYESAFYKESLLISLTHEIYRLVLNNDYSSQSTGNENAIELFLSHAKDDSEGVSLARELKTFIDNKTMSNFFDTTDIAPAYKFDDEIKKHIKNSTLIAIHSDSYSSRYWCQREIQYAKKYRRPIIAVDYLDVFEDRRFPLATNFPGIHLHQNSDGNVTKKDLYRILTAALLETTRYYYAQKILQNFKDNGWFPPESILLPCPPEITDIVKAKNTSDSTPNYNILVYPEPPVYDEEFQVFKDLGVQMYTPLNFPGGNFTKLNVGISVSDPDKRELVRIGQSASHLIQLSQELARHILAKGNTLIYGGDLRPNGFTDFIFTEAQVLQSRIQTDNIFIKNYLTWPLYVECPDILINWKAEHRAIASMIEVDLPENVSPLVSDINSFLEPKDSKSCYIWATCLTKMRNDMVSDCDIRICAGGKHIGYKGKMPGVLEEAIITINNEKPIYLLGGFGGVTQSICELIISQKMPEKITCSWQKKNNPLYTDILEYIKNNNSEYMPNYNEFKDIFTFDNLRNGLSEDENVKLFNTPYVDEALHFVFLGISRIYSNR